MQCSDTLQIIATLTLINACTCSVERANSHNSPGSSGGGGHLESFNERTSSQTYYADSVYRNLDTQLLRIGSRLDQLMIRMDHLDSRVGRVQSTGHLRFDSIETSMQTTRQRLDLWSNQLNLIEEQLSRKWKNMESRFDSLVSTLDSKLDTKFNLIQRDNRRHNEFISQSFNSVIISQEKLSDRVGHSISEINSTLLSTQSIVNDSASTVKSKSLDCASRLDNLVHNLTSSFTATTTNAYYSPPNHQQQHSNARRNSNAIQPTDQLSFVRPLYSSYGTHNNHYPPSPQNQNSTAQLISTKVSNMFDELVKRSHDLEAIVKDTFTMSNLTRREVQDGFMALIPIVSQVGLGNEKGSSGSSSGEVMSAMVVEALSSVEQLSTALGRRMTELNRSINERFEMVSMTLNGFLESCLRIQERTPQLETEIAQVLWKVLDSVDNSTRNATETWANVKSLLSLNQINVTNCTQNLSLLQRTPSIQPRVEEPAPPHVENPLPDGRNNDTAWDSLFRAYENLAQEEHEDNEFDINNNNNGRQYPNSNHQHGGGGGDVVMHNNGELTSEQQSRFNTDFHHQQTNLSEEQKKLLWESLSRLGGGGEEEEHVPE